MSRTKRNALCGVALSLLVAGTLATGQSNSIHEQIRQTYNFQPHSLSDQERTQKSAALDQFWHRAEAQRSEYISALRQELADFEDPPFFLYDGSMLLLSLSDTSADRKIALAAMARCDLRDVQSRDYFYQVHRLATLDEDTTAAAFHILTEPRFQVFIPQHALTLAQNYALIYLLLPTDQDHWLQPAIQRLKNESDQTAQQSLLLLLCTPRPMWQTPPSSRLVAVLASRPHLALMRRNSFIAKTRSGEANARKLRTRVNLHSVRNVGSVSGR